MRDFAILLLMLAALAASGACSGSKKAPTTPSAAAGRAASGSGGVTPSPTQAASEQSAPEARPGLPLGPIYFPYDEATLSEEARSQLERAREYLAKHAEVRLVIAGHADERGTPEYNLALGEQRARVCSDYLRRLGVDAARLRTISYGEERPANEGADEVSLSKNRRAELELSR